MKIIRNDNSYILKRKINLNNWEKYDEVKIMKAKEILKRIINETVVNDFLFLKEIMNFQKNNDIKARYVNYQNKKCYNCCTSLAMKLKRELDKILKNVYYITCKANGFSTFRGNQNILEAHTFLGYCCLKDNKRCFVIFDAGFRNYNAVIFLENENSDFYNYESGYVRVLSQKNEDYPYKLCFNKTLKRNFKIVDSDINLEFNPYYETLKILDFDKACYRVKHSYKIMDYQNKVCIGLNIINGELTLYSSKKEENYNLKELLLKSDDEIASILKFYFEMMTSDFSVSDFILVLRFIPEWVSSGVLEREVIDDVLLNNF